MARAGAQASGAKTRAAARAQEDSPATYLRKPRASCSIPRPEKLVHAVTGRSARRSRLHRPGLLKRVRCWGGLIIGKRRPRTRAGTPLRLGVEKATTPCGRT